MNKKETGVRRAYFDGMDNILGHHNLEQLVMEDMWCRSINSVITSSRLDHVYTNLEEHVSNIKLVNNVYSYHMMVMLNYDSYKLQCWKKHIIESNVDP